MKFKEYVKKLNDLLVSRPESGELDVVASSDGEGNGFNPVHYDPSIGYFDGEYGGEFTGENSEDFDEETDGKPNAVCVN